jgi:apolipoprotein N-acyltransferase
VPEATLLRVQPGARVETVLCGIAQELASLGGWRRFGLAFLLGLVLAATLPPVDLTPLLLVAFPGLLWLDDGSAGTWASFRLGYAFGIGFFLAGLYWIAAALFVDIGRFWWLVPLALFGFPAVFALYSGLALAATRLVSTGLRLSGTARICAFAIAWTGAEWLRGHLLTGFPWNEIGYAWAGGFPGATAVLQSVAWIGINGLGLMTVLAASLPALFGTPSVRPLSRARRCAPAFALVLFIGIPAVGGAIRLAHSPTVLTATRLRLVQPSIPQELKWDPKAAAADFQRLVALSAAPAAHPLAATLWPEAAVPFLIERDTVGRDAIARLAPAGGYVITGAIRADPPPQRAAHLWNSIEAVDREGEVVGRYDKAHLVPFGEYVPLRGILPLPKITAGLVDLSAGPGPRTISLRGLPPFAPLICYEAIFPSMIVDENHRPAWLLNVTNDAWYGETSGPYQHFAIARTRAIEEGLPLVRVANNGISGVIDPVGRVLARTNLNDVGYVDITLPEMRGATPFSRFGDRILLVLLVVAAIPVVLRLR